VQRLPDPMVWLADGIPLTLVIDMLDELGPHSRQILAAEPADVSWVTRTSAA
jgi:hypothetical protein